MGGGLPGGIPRRRWRVGSIAFYSRPVRTWPGVCPRVCTRRCVCAWTRRPCWFVEVSTCNTSSMRRVIRARNINVASRTGDDFVPWTTRQLNRHYPWPVHSPRLNLCASLKADRHPSPSFVISSISVTPSRLSLSAVAFISSRYDDAIFFTTALFFLSFFSSFIFLFFAKGANRAIERKLFIFATPRTKIKSVILMELHHGVY